MSDNNGICIKLLLSILKANMKLEIINAIAEKLRTKFKIKIHYTFNNTIFLHSTIDSSLSIQTRKFELSMEGHRFFDLVRTGQAPIKITGFVEGKHEVFPIPQQEIDISGLTQNPGY